jgi:hypothetical protein
MFVLPQFGARSAAELDKIAIFVVMMPGEASKWSPGRMGIGSSQRSFQLDRGRLTEPAIMIRKMDAAPMTSSIRVAPLKTYMMPNASDEYRAARENLIDAELALREHVQRVAALRRTLPAGPTIPDYEFVEGDERVRLSELFSDGRPYHD